MKEAEDIDAAETHRPQASSDAPLVILGYLAAVSAVTLSFLIDVGIFVAQNRRWDDFSLLLQFGLIFWVVAAITALPPFVLTVFVASRLTIRNRFYYAICGLVTGLILTPVGTAIGDTLDGPDRTQSFLQGCLSAGPTFLVDGLCGGLVFWLIAGRRMGVTHAAAPLDND